MQDGSAIIKAVKDLGWDKITLSVKKGFPGAVKVFTNGKTSVAVCFGMHDAFIVKDDLGLYTADDLYTSIIKDKSFSVEEYSDIVGASLMAYEQDGEVAFTDTFANSGIDTPEIREDITARLKACAALDVMVDVELG